MEIATNKQKNKVLISRVSKKFGYNHVMLTQIKI